MSSQTQKTTAPNIQAIEIAYLALRAFSSSFEAVVTISQLTHPFWIELQISINHKPEEIFLSLKLDTLSSSLGHKLFAHASRSFSVCPPMIFKYSNQTTCQTIAKMAFQEPLII